MSMSTPFTTACAARVGVLLVVLGLGAAGLQAGPVRDRIQQLRQERASEASTPSDGQAELGGAVGEPEAQLKATGQMLILRDVPYGGNKLQRFDVYAPKDAANAPVIFMVHGGGWKRGSKSARSVVQAKVTRWVPKGFVVVSTNYRMLPTLNPQEQAWDVAQALAKAQSMASGWGADRQKFILMGHSAGAHLVSLIHASPVLATGRGASPWLGTVSLDSAALDVVAMMERRHLPLYDRAFGRDPGFWHATSPQHQMGKGMAPLLAVCAAERPDTPCEQAERFRDKAQELGNRVAVLPVKLSHREINLHLGDLGPHAAYTEAVEQFMASLDADVAQRLKP